VTFAISCNSTPASYDPILLVALSIICLFLIIPTTAALGAVIRVGIVAGALSRKSEAISRGAHMLKTPRSRGDAIFSLFLKGRSQEAACRILFATNQRSQHFLVTVVLYLVSAPTSLNFQPEGNGKKASAALSDDVG
jgi:hypothetical protein